MRLGRLPTISHNARSEASEHAFALVAIPRQDPLRIPPHFGVLLIVGARPVPSAPISQGTLPGDPSTTLSMTCFDVPQTILFNLVVGARPVLGARL